MCCEKMHFYKRRILCIRVMNQSIDDCYAFLPLNLQLLAIDLILRTTIDVVFQFISYTKWQMVRL